MISCSFSQLPQLGVSPDYIKFGTCSMESDKTLCVCEKTPAGQSQIVIVNLENGSVDKRGIAAEAAIMNPVSRIIALRGKSFP